MLRLIPKHFQRAPLTNGESVQHEELGVFGEMCERREPPNLGGAA